MSAPVLLADARRLSTQHPALSTQDICLGPVEDIPFGQGRAFKVGRETVAVFRRRDGRLYAIQNECPHRGGPLAEGLFGAGTVLCPFHAWKVDVETGDCLTEPCTLRTYPIREESGQIFLGMRDEG